LQFPGCFIEVFYIVIPEMMVSFLSNSIKVMSFNYVLTLNLPFLNEIFLADDNNNNKSS